MIDSIILKEAVIADVIRKYPKCKKVFRYYNIDKIGCGWGGFSTLTIEQAAQSKNIDIDKIIIKLSKVIKRLE